MTVGHENIRNCPKHHDRSRKYGPGLNITTSGSRDQDKSGNEQNLRRDFSAASDILKTRVGESILDFLS